MANKAGLNQNTGFLHLEMILCLFVLSEVDMRVSSEVWAVLNSRLEELLRFLNSDQPETTQTLCALKGLALILHLAALCSSPTW